MNCKNRCFSLLIDYFCKIQNLIYKLMKKQLLFILSILFCSCSLIAQSPDARKIDLTQRGGNIKDGRSDFPSEYR